MLLVAGIMLAYEHIRCAAKSESEFIYFLEFGKLAYFGYSRLVL